VNNLRFEVRNLSMDNQRLMAQLEFSARMGANKASRRDQDDSDLMFPQYQQYQQPQQQQQQQQTATFPNHAQSQPLLSAHQHQHQQLIQLPFATSDLQHGGEFPFGSVDSNELQQANADYFRQLREGVTAAPVPATTTLRGGVIKAGKGGAGKQVSKSHSTPFFTVKAVSSSSGAAEAARMSLGAGGGGGSGGAAATVGQQQDSVASRRTISGMSSFADPLGGGGSGALAGGSSSNHNNNKNEYARTADEKIAALIELNEQHLRASKEEQQKAKQQSNEPAVASSSKGGLGVAKSGKAKASTGGAGVSGGFASSTDPFAEGTSVIQLPNINRINGKAK
jgi:hypothetical protein